MKENTIKVLKVEVGQAPIVKEIANELNALQTEVDGLIECVYLDDGCIAVVNEEGKINGMEPNRRMGADIICGPFFICGDTADGEFASLSEEQTEKYSQQFAEIEQFTGNEPELSPRMTFIGFDYLGGR
ncbi:hypothetical protein SDC9_137213 [bioreactor metagenome]|uniref:DUF3846 domain-containing protein n=1 Tax=bioreactor metagenome TaxID=1076179 RepID=A0A645DL98_9ZZZZ